MRTPVKKFRISAQGVLQVPKQLSMGTFETRKRGICEALQLEASRSAAPPARPLAEKSSYPKTVFRRIEMCVKFQHSSSNSFRDMRGVKFTLGALHPRTPPSGKFFKPEKST